jgi:hypothetical protein
MLPAGDTVYAANLVPSELHTTLVVVWGRISSWMSCSFGSAWGEAGDGGAWAGAATVIAWTATTNNSERNDHRIRRSITSSLLKLRCLYRRGDAARG